MTETLDFLAAILAAPNDDSLRWAYADWLDEQGEGERAEFIRVQLVLTTMQPGTVVWDMRDAFLRRERELLETCGGVWNGELLEAVGVEPGVFGLGPYHRGFIETVTCTAAAWLVYGDAILAAQPVREVALTTWPGWAADASRENTEANLRHNWPRVTTWHLPGEVES